MRTTPALLLLLGIALAAPARAQFPTTLGQAGAVGRVNQRGQGAHLPFPLIQDGASRRVLTGPAASSPLPIPLPPGAAVQMELDGRDADLLGMVKGLLAGTATPKTRAGAQGTVGGSPALSFLGNGQLTLLLKDIHHLHVVSFKPADPPAVTFPASATAPPPTDFLAFYEKPFEAEGGHRLLYLNSGSSPVVTVGFDQPRGFAAVFQSSGMVYVVRADGYPDMTVLGGLLRTFGAAAPTPNMPVPAPAARKATVRKAAHPKARRS